jgi:hypothetical protein
MKLGFVLALLLAGLMAGCRDDSPTEPSRVIVAKCRSTLDPAMSQACPPN